jgi:dolichyl-phosphate-mannose--protein O-mannosyl transferase
MTNAQTYISSFFFLPICDNDILANSDYFCYALKLRFRLMCQKAKVFLLLHQWRLQLWLLLQLPMVCRIDSSYFSTTFFFSFRDRVDNELT